VIFASFFPEVELTPLWSGSSTFFYFLFFYFYFVFILYFILFFLGGRGKICLRMDIVAILSTFTPSMEVDKTSR